VAPELVGRLVELGILRPGDTEAPYGPIPPVPLKGVADPVPLHRATRPVP
jgi:hypothetical protein